MASTKAIKHKEVEVVAIAHSPIVTQAQKIRGRTSTLVAEYKDGNITAALKELDELYKVYNKTLQILNEALDDNPARG